MTRPQLDRETELGYRALRSIRKIIHDVSSHSRLMSNRIGLTVPQLLCLRAIQESSTEINVAGVADRVSISRPTVSGVVDRLAQAELIERVRGKHDRRHVYLSLTGKGHAKLAAAPKPLPEHFLARLTRFSEAEKEWLLSALEQLAGLKDEEDGSPDTL